MKDKRQKLVMSWAAAAPLHAWTLALQARQYSYAAPLHYYASWELHRAAATTYNPRLIITNADWHSNADEPFNPINSQPPTLSRDPDVTSGSRDDPTTTTSALFRPYNLS